MTRPPNPADRRTVPVRDRPKPRTLVEASEDYTDTAIDLGRAIRCGLVDPAVRWIGRHRMLAVLIVVAWVTAIVVAAIAGGPSQGWAP